MKIDIKKVIGTQEDKFDIAKAMIKAQQELLEAIHIMDSTVENFSDLECLLLNKQRMVDFLKKYAKP